MGALWRSGLAFPPSEGVGKEGVASQNGREGFTMNYFSQNQGSINKSGKRGKGAELNVFYLRPGIGPNTLSDPDKKFMRKKGQRKANPLLVLQEKGNPGLNPLTSSTTEARRQSGSAKEWSSVEARTHERKTSSQKANRKVAESFTRTPTS